MESQSLPSGAWLVHVGHHSDLIARSEAEGVVALNCPDLGDLNGLETRVQLENWLSQKAPTLSPDLRRRYAGELFCFRQLMAPGDYVLAHD